MAVAHAEQAARQSVFHELSTLTANGSYGCLSKDKPDNVVRLMYKNFSSLSLFVEGPKKHVKIRQLNKIITDYSVTSSQGARLEPIGNTSTRKKVVLPTYLEMVS